MPLLVTASMLLLASCGSDLADDADGSGGVVGEWLLESGSLDGTPIELVDGWRVTLTLNDDDSLGGTAACNGYGGTYELDGTVFAVGELSWTEMGCEPAVMDLEQTFLIALKKVDSVERVDNTLFMTGQEAELNYVLVVPPPPSELVGTTWELHTIIDGDAATNVMSDGYVLFDADGTFEASTGCRDVVGEYVLNGDEIGVTQMSASGECSDSLDWQDNFVISVLESPRFEIDGNQLRLWAAGNEGLQYSAEADLG